MSHQASTRSSLRAVAFLVGLLAVVLLAPGRIEALLVVIAHGDVYIFAPTGVTVGQEVRLVYHNFTGVEHTVQFLLVDADGHDRFVANKINATMKVAPGKMAMVAMPCDQILDQNETLADVTGVVVITAPGMQSRPFKPRGFVGPASLQLVDELTKRTLLTVPGVVTPVDLAGAVGPMYLGGASVPIE